MYVIIQVIGRCWITQYQFISSGTISQKFRDNSPERLQRVAGWVGGSNGNKANLSPAEADAGLSLAILVFEEILVIIFKYSLSSNVQV